MMVFEVVQNIGTIMCYNVEMTVNRYAVLSFMNYGACVAVNVIFALLVVAVVAQHAHDHILEMYTSWNDIR